jgi:hypothetical protein
MITKEYSTKQFLQFHPMVEKAVWKYSKKYHLDREEVSGQAYLIFCEALEKLNPDKASFSTYLFNELNRLDNYCKCEYRKNKKSVQRIKHNHIRGYGHNIFINRLYVEETIKYDYKVFEKVLNKIDYEISLSDDAKDILQYILSREWEDVETNWIPRFSYIKMVYATKGWAGNRIINSWNEIKLWWQNSNKDQFCMEV